MNFEEVSAQIRYVDPNPEIQPGCDLKPDYTLLLYPEGQSSDRGIVENGQAVTFGPGQSNGITSAEYLTEGGLLYNVGDYARMDIYLPRGKALPLMTIACPGGGYSLLSVYGEGLYQAKWMVEHGIACCVLKYRMPCGHYGIPLTDVQNAMRYLRRHAPEWGVEKIGVVGYSAGGHLASCAATMYADAATRPDFAVLLYPRMSLRADEECSTRDYLVGTEADWKDAPEEYRRILALCSPENFVRGEGVSGVSGAEAGAGTPPVFIALCADDDSVPPDHFTTLYSALLGSGVSVEVHVFPSGGHGFGFGDESLVGKGNDHFSAFRPEFYSLLERWLLER